MDDDPYRTPGRVNLNRTGPFPCPRCGSPLDKSLGIQQMYCAIGKCGQWLGRDALDTFLAIPEHDTGELPDLARAMRKALMRAEPAPALCPACDETLEVEVRARVVFDYCQLHGVWLDRQELDALQGALTILKWT